MLSARAAGRVLARDGGHHTIRSKSYAKPKTKQIQGLSQTFIYEWISVERKILRLFPFKTLFQNGSERQG
jgi:hypothetical protein